MKKNYITQKKYLHFIHHIYLLNLFIQ